jgi:hypothetical protein
MIDATKLFVLEKCNALDDDSQPYTSYSYATSENGISTNLPHAAIFASEEEAMRGRLANNWVIRAGGFKCVTLASAMYHMVSYNAEMKEYDDRFDEGWRRDANN